MSCGKNTPSRAQDRNASWVQSVNAVDHLTGDLAVEVHSRFSPPWRWPRSRLPRAEERDLAELSLKELLQVQLGQLSIGGIHHTHDAGYLRRTPRRNTGLSLPITGLVPSGLAQPPVGGEATVRHR